MMTIRELNEALKRCKTLKEKSDLIFKNSGNEHTI